MLAQTTSSREPFPLKSLLTLYVRASTDTVYTDYMLGFKLLYEWLSPIAIPTDPVPPLRRDLYNYTQQEMAVILKCSPAIIQHTLLEIYRDGY